MSRHRIADIAAQNAANVAAMPICAWVSRHQPTREQRRTLKGYAIARVHCRLPVSQVIWSEVLKACDEKAPQLVMLITKHEAVTPTVRHILQQSPPTVIVQPIMQRDIAGEWIWSGRWVRLELRETGVVSVAWTPEVKP